MPASPRYYLHLATVLWWSATLLGHEPHKSSNLPMPPIPAIPGSQDCADVSMSSCEAAQHRYPWIMSLMCHRAAIRNNLSPPSPPPNAFRSARAVFDGSMRQES